MMVLFEASLTFAHTDVEQNQLIIKSWKSTQPLVSHASIYIVLYYEYEYHK